MSNTQAMTWVLLRGLTREHRHWENFPQLLQSAFPNAKIITPDLPGSGNHHQQQCPVHIKDILECVRADITVSQLNKPIYIIGLSLGAMVGLEWLRQYPQECAGAVLINTSFKGLNPFYQRLRPVNYWRLLKSQMIINIQSRENIVFDLTSNLDSNRASIINNWVRYARENPVSKSNALRQLIAAFLYKIPRQKPEPPILLLNSRGDHLVNPECSQRLAQHWDLPLQSHPSAGHDLTLDDGAWACEKIIAWLQQQ